MPRLSKIGAAALGAFGWTSGSSITATYLVVAGGGGGAGWNAVIYSVGQNGSNSQFGTLTAAVGGGGGAAYTGGNAGNGGSGGGGSGYGTTTAGTGTSGQGNNGGSGQYTGGNGYYGGGGGGAGAAGANASSTNGNGGVGLANPISGSTAGQLVGATYYLAGGGGGGSWAAAGGSAGTGGNGGGGNGAESAAGSPGTANTGGGGGGGDQGTGAGQGGGGAGGFLTGTTTLNLTLSYTVTVGAGGSGSAYGGKGGSGVVIISYLGAQQFGGGVVTSSGGYTIHTFNTSGTLSPLSSLTASYLIVAGGGGGGLGRGGGGGAGGLLSGSGVTIDTNSNYLVTVGSGGTGSTSSSSAGSSGSNSAFSMVTTTAVGGGGGGSAAAGPGVTGGSGGGAGGAGSGNTGASGTSGQGNAGGNSVVNNAGGGGGGSSSVGVAGSVAVGGNGGNGTSSSISGSSASYAGGGGGGAGGTGSPTAGTGQAGGGNGGGSTGNGSNATANTGSGGGGGGDVAPRDGGNGGSGVVIISYAGATQQMAGGTVTISGGNVIHTFTSSGYLTPLKLVNNSLRFRASNNNYLARTYGTPTNNKVWTWSAWVKRGSLSLADANHLFMASPTDVTGNPSVYTRLIFETDNTLRLQSNGSAGELFTSSAVYRDPAAWYHIVLSMNASSTVVNCFVNGTEITYASRTNPTNTNTAINGAGNFHRMGFFRNAEPRPFDGYMTEINFVDGQALTPNSFGTFNSYGVWQPITYGGSYGTNGFYLPMNPGNSTFNGSFNGTTQYLSTTSGITNQFTPTSGFTFEMWVYQSNSGTNQTFYVGGGTNSWSTTSGYLFGLLLGSSQQWQWNNAGSTFSIGMTVPSNQWAHIAIGYNGTTTRVWVNGVSAGTSTSPYTVPTTVNQYVIGSNFGGASNFSAGQFSNLRFVKGTDVYGVSNATISVPTSALTAITNTQLLTLQNSTIIDNSTNAFSITNTGTVTTTVAYPFNLNNTVDYSPQGNNWTNNNIGMVVGTNFDSMTDVPTLTSATVANYCTLNPLKRGTTYNPTISNGNLSYQAEYNTQCPASSTMGVPSGTYYYEATIVLRGYSPGVGVCDPSDYFGTGDNWRTYMKGVILFYDGTLYNNGSSSATAYTFTTGDVMSVAFNATNGKIWIAKNGTYYNSGNPAAGTGQIATATTYANLAPIVDGTNNAGSKDQIALNFGQQPFVYTAPSGFVALNTYNI